MAQMILIRFSILSIISLFHLSLHCMEAPLHTLNEFNSIVNEQNDALVQSLSNLLKELESTNHPYKPFLLSKGITMLRDPKILEVSRELFEHQDHYHTLKKAIESIPSSCSETYAREQIIPCWHAARTNLNALAKQRKMQDMQTGSAAHFILSALHLSYLTKIYPHFEHGEQDVKEALTATSSPDDDSTKIIIYPSNPLQLFFSLLQCPLIFKAVI